jgi:succinate--hydroxymethylglutarate CoA-transferase
LTTRKPKSGLWSKRLTCVDRRFAFDTLTRHLQHPLIGKAKIVAPAILYQGERMPVSSFVRFCRLAEYDQIERAPPGLGEDNYDILKEIGYDRAAVDKLQSQGVV